MGAFQAPKKFAERFEFVVDLFPTLGDRRKQRAGSLSGGERQMVAMARALMMEPSVLLLDEPSAGLSPVRQDETFIRTRKINKAGVSSSSSSRTPAARLQICDRGYVLDQGRNAYSGPGRQLMNDPKVIELYLGTLATDVEAARTRPAAPAHREGLAAVGPGRCCGPAGFDVDVRGARPTSVMPSSSARNRNALAVRVVSARPRGPRPSRSARAARARSPAGGRSRTRARRAPASSPRRCPWRPAPACARRGPPARRRDPAAPR